MTLFMGAAVVVVVVMVQLPSMLTPLTTLPGHTVTGQYGPTITGGQYGMYG